MSESDKTARRGPHRWAKGEAPAHGRWTKGQTASRGGIYGSFDLQRQLEGRSGHRTIRKLFRSRSAAVMYALRRLIVDQATPAAIKVEAARLFLEYGWGKPEASVVKSGKAKNEEPIVVVRRTPRSPHNSGGV